MGNNLVEVKEQLNVTELVIGPAPSNIISEAVMDEIIAEIEKCVKSPDKKLIILSGSGDHFSFGASVAEHTPEKVGAMLPKFHLLIDKILSCPIPVMAKVRGNCLGGGFEVAIACHFIFAEKTASFAVPEIKLGVLPPPASVLLPLIIGDKLACQIILTGSAKLAEELKNYNLVNQVCDDKESLDKSIDLFITKQITPLSASSLRIASQAARLDLIDKYRNNIKIVEKLYLKNLMKTQDAVEGITSFIEKRKPNWKNK